MHDFQKKPKLHFIYRSCMQTSHTNRLTVLYGTIHNRGRSTSRQFVTPEVWLHKIGKWNQYFPTERNILMRTYPGQAQRRRAKNTITFTCVHVSIHVQYGTNVQYSTICLVQYHMFVHIQSITTIREEVIIGMKILFLVPVTHVFIYNCCIL